ncbi:MAG: hypothetical protein ABIJ09_23135 [Pseudomonadota bacterium]
MLAASLAARGASAQELAGEERVLVLGLVDSGVGEDATRRITSVLRTEVASVVAGRYVEAKGALASESCPLENLTSCAASKGRLARAGLVVVGTVAALADVQLVDLRVIDVVGGVETGRLQSALGGTAEENRRVLRELSVRLLAPQAYVGSLAVENLAAGDQLVVDGAEVQTEVPTTRVTLPVGQHAIEVLNNEDIRLSEIVDIAFDRTHVAHLGGTPEAVPEPTTSSPSWPFWASLSASALTAVTSVALLSTFFALDLMGQLEAAENNKQDRIRSDSACIVPPGRDNNVSQFYYCDEQIDTATTNIALVLGGAAATGLLAIGSGVAAGLLFSSGSEATEDTVAAP